MNADTLRPTDPTTARNAARNAARTTEATTQAERLAWLFRSIRPEGRPHPLRQPLACLRDMPEMAFTAAGADHAGPALGAPQQPRHTIDRAWLQRRVAALPTLPAAVALALRVLQQDDSSTRDCADALGSDPALVARVLRLANAAAYGRSGHIGSVHDAISLLGRRTVSAVLTAAAVSGPISGARCRGFDLHAHWREAVASGIAAQTLAAEVGADSGLAFTAGLLHDFGRLVLVSQLPEAMEQVLDWARLHDQPMHVAEHEVLGIDHAEAGALVARHWQFPPVLVAAIGSHHAADGLASDPDHQWLCDLVQGADAVAHALDLHHAEHERVPALAPALWQRLQLSPAGCARVLAVSEQGVAALAGSLAP